MFRGPIKIAQREHEPIKKFSKVDFFDLGAALGRWISTQSMVR